MGPVKRVLRWLALAVVVSLVGYLGLSIYASARQGYSWQEMDWNQKGSTSVSDFLAAADIGKRQVTKDGKACVEYFAYKDGMPVKLVCPPG